MAPYRLNEGRLIPEDLDSSLCTHMIYVSAKVIEVEGGWGIGPIEWTDQEIDFTGFDALTEDSFTEEIDWAEEMYTRFHNVTKAHPGTKVSTFSL